jgi:hypothetical protein
MKSFGDRDTTAFTYVWWQVLLMAYVWKCQIRKEIFDSQYCFADKLVKSLFADNGNHKTFKKFINAKWERLKYLSQRCHGWDDVEELLEIVTVAFKKQN